MKTVPKKGWKTVPSYLRARDIQETIVIGHVMTKRPGDNYAGRLERKYVSWENLEHDIEVEEELTEIF